MKTVETIIWCPVCKVDKATIYRVPTGSEGVYQNEPDRAFGKYCSCGAVLERKPGGDQSVKDGNG